MHRRNSGPEKRYCWNFAPCIGEARTTYDIAVWSREVQHDDDGRIAQKKRQVMPGNLSDMCEGCEGGVQE